MLGLPLLFLAAAADLAPLKASLLARHGEGERARIERGVTQVAARWRREDGDLAAFVRDAFLPRGPQLELAFQRFEAAMEQVDGHFLELRRELRRPTELDLGPVLAAVDTRFAAWEPAAHLTEDLFASQLAWVALLNFPVATLEERAAKGAGWSREAWAEVRLTQRFDRRIPAPVEQALAAAEAGASLYIDQYNVWMHHVVGPKGERLFPKGLRLISHWNLRDELKAAYADPAGLPRQRLLLQVMERIVTQSIPAAVIDNPRLDWDPVANTVAVAPAAEVEADAPARPATPDPRPEGAARYQRWLTTFQAQRQADPFVPSAPTALARAFADAELPEARVKAMLEEVLTSPLVPRVAAQVEARLGRKLEPQDLWYAGFLPRGKLPEAELDARVRARYPTPGAFAADLPRILGELGFAKDRAAFVAERVRVDPSRGAGHAQPAARRGDFPRLRTRVEKEGMNYKGYNIAVHEFGHNVEQVFSLYSVDHTLLTGVPNTAFTEALAFVFQARDLELLGLGAPDAEAERARVLGDFWATWEIAGVALVDLAVWHWVYEHPRATAAQLKDAAVGIARDTWRRYYQPVLGGSEVALLGIYSHLVAYPLYVFNYPLGHLISFQIEEQVRKAGKVGPEFERMASYGKLSPDLWMVNATGAAVGTGPLLRATEAALAAPAAVPPR